MKPKLLMMMICLLRSSAAALATHPRGGGGGVVGTAGSKSRAFHYFARATRGGAMTTSTLDEDSCSGSDNTSTALHQTSRNFQSDSITTTSPQLLSSGHIAFRLARRTDVPQIQSCNLATLPENYNANFYINHMRAWPELTLVAEHIPEGFELDGLDDNTNEGGGGEYSQKITPLSDYIRDRNKPKNKKPRKEIVGYILGKIEERPINPTRSIFPPSRVPLYNDDEETLLQYMNNGNANGARFPSQVQQQLQQPKEKIGHVTSLAVNSHARRLGIASSLLHQLHFHLQHCYGADSIGLHVRISNEAAVRLYCEEGYDVADIIPMYYGDGEDAYFMRKDFDSIVVSESMPATKQQRQVQEPQQQQRRLRRGEKERNEWLNRDATRNGSFFDNRKSMRDTLSEEERAWVNGNNASANPNGSDQQQPSTNPRTGMTANTSMNNASSSSSLPGQFKRSFRTFFNGKEQVEQQQRQQNKFQSPPWEAGPQWLRLPRYSKVCRKEKKAIIDLEAKCEEEEEEEDDDIEYYGEEEDSLSLDAVVASGSV